MSIKERQKGSIVPLVQLWEAFQADQPGGDLAGFNQWMLVHRVALSEPTAAVTPPQGDAATESFKVDEGRLEIENLNFAAGYLISRLFKFLKIYTKALLQGETIHSMDEFGLLASIEEKGALKISDLCKILLLEFSTVAAIVKRLVAVGLLMEGAHTNDRRAKLVDMTPAGRQYFYGILTKFSTLPELMEGFAKDEQILFLNLLNRLDLVHSKKMAIGKGLE